MVDSSGNEWLGLLMDWELAESSCSLQNEGSSTLSYEGGVSDCECTNTQDTQIHISAGNIFNHTNEPTCSHHINTTSPCLPPNATLLKVDEGHISIGTQDCSPSSLSATSSTSQSQHILPLKLALDAPNNVAHSKGQVIKDTSSPSYYNSYNTIIEKEESIWPHDSLMMGTDTCGRQKHVRSHVAINKMPISMSVKDKATHTYTLRNEGNVGVLEKARDNSKATNSVPWGHHLVNTKKDDNLSHLISGINHEAKKAAKPWISLNHFNRSNETDAIYKKISSPQPHRSKKITTSSSLSSSHPTIAFHQNSQSLTLSFNQKSHPVPKMPHSLHDHVDKDYNKTLLGIYFGDPNYGLIGESELDGMHGISRVDDEESFSLINDTYRTKKKIKVEDDSSARHCLAERKRREKLNKKFDELRAIVGPSLSVKTDKSSIIGAAIKLLLEKNCTKSSPKPKESPNDNQLQQALSNNKGTSQICDHSMPKVNKAKHLQDPSPSFQHDMPLHSANSHVSLSKVFCDLQDDFELQKVKWSSSCDLLFQNVKVDAKQDPTEGKRYIINVRAPKRPTIFEDIFFTLSRLELEVIFANSCISTDNTLPISSPTVTWLLLKVDAIDKSSTFDCNKCDIITKAIQGCIGEPQK